MNYVNLDIYIQSILYILYYLRIEMWKWEEKYWTKLTN